MYFENILFILRWWHYDSSLDIENPFLFISYLRRPFALECCKNAVICVEKKSIGFSNTNKIIHFSLRLEVNCSYKNYVGFDRILNICILKMVYYFEIYTNVPERVFSHKPDCETSRSSYFVKNLLQSNLKDNR